MAELLFIVVIGIGTLAVLAVVVGAIVMSTSHGSAWMERRWRRMSGGRDPRDEDAGEGGA